MGYRLFDKNGNLVILHDLQDKGPWCSRGASFEEVFITKYGKEFELSINPAKVTDIYAPDLLNLKTKGLADLKTQNTPFFQARSRYGLDPQYSVTFNTKDYHRYLQYYPTIEIYFWVDWIVTGFEGTEKIQVAPMNGIWKIPFEGIKELVKSAPIHSYQQRVSDTIGNAKGSFVFDLNNEFFEKLL